MKTYLDLAAFPDFVARYFGTESHRHDRLVGPARQHDSLYYDIVRFFGKSALDPAEVRIDYESAQCSLSDPRIAEFAREIAAELRAEGRLYDGPLCARLADCSFDANQPFLRLQPASYDDQAGTCFALDYAHRLFDRFGGSLREYYKRCYSSSRIADSPLCLCLGVAAMVLCRDHSRDYLLEVKRSSALASLENSYGPSVAGSVDFKLGYSNLRELHTNALTLELREELRIEIDEAEIIPLAYAREIFRGERPQLFALIRTTLNREDVTRRLETMNWSE